MHFSHYPVLKILLPYIFGIILGYFLPINNLNLLFCIFGIVFFCSIFILFLRKKNYFLHNMIVILMYIAFIFAGYISISFHFYKNQDSINMEKITQKQIWMAEILEMPREREKSYKIVAKLHAFNDTTYWITQKVVLYFQKDSVIKQMFVGDKLVVYTQLSFIEPPKNPEQFDYAKFMKRKGVLLTGYVGKQNWEKQEGKSKKSIRRFSSFMQQFLSNKLLLSGMSGAEYSVAAAILLGNDETLEPELRASYAATGVSHILCVSGMHVGVIFMILGFLLKPLDKHLKTRYLKNVILLVAVWVYANITGLAPSVTRSAAMFTFVITGKFLQRKTNIFHSLFASLFILLVYNPLLLFEVGFQLSYLAVFGIVLFQNGINQWYKPRTKVGNYFWNLISVSIAAQITTSPIAILYFGQFPNYFLLTNLFVIPVSFVITILGVATLVLSFNSFISTGLGFVLNFGVKVMNEGVLFIEKLPGALTPNLSINMYQVILLYMLIILICFFRKKIKLTILLSMIILNGFFLIQSINRVKNKNYIDVVNYEISKSIAFQFCYLGNGIIFSDFIHNEDDKRYQFSIKNHDIKMGISNSFIKLDEDFENSFLCKKGNYIFFQNRIYYVEKNRLKSLKF